MVLYVWSSGLKKDYLTYMCFSEKQGCSINKTNQPSLYYHRYRHLNGSHLPDRRHLLQRDHGLHSLLFLRFHAENSAMDRLQRRKLVEMSCKSKNTLK